MDFLKSRLLNKSAVDVVGFANMTQVWMMDDAGREDQWRAWFQSQKIKPCSYFAEEY
jgi:hypothetical protein